MAKTVAVPLVAAFQLAQELATLHHQQALQQDLKHEDHFLSRHACTLPQKVVHL